MQLALALPLPTAPAPIASGEKAKARDIIAAIKTLQRIEREKRLATPDERQVLARFGGFGAVALTDSAATNSKHTGITLSRFMAHFLSRKKRPPARLGTVAGLARRTSSSH